MAESIQISVELIDNMSKELKEINSKIADMNAKAKKAGEQTSGAFSDITNGVKAMVGAYLGFEGIKAGIGFLMDSSKAAQESELAVTNLTSALKQQGVTSADTATAMATYASSLQTATGFNDEAIMSIQTLAVRYGYLGEANDSLVEATLNLSRATGTDMNSAMMMLIRSMTKENDELGRLGLSINGVSGSAERFDSILGSVNEKFGDASQAYMSSYAGKLDAMKNKYDDLQEEIGKKLLPIQTSWLNGLNSILDRFMGEGVDSSNLQEQINEAQTAFDEFNKVVAFGGEQESTNQNFAIVSLERRKQYGKLLADGMKKDDAAQIMRGQAKLRLESLLSQQMEEQNAKIQWRKTSQIGKTDPSDQDKEKAMTKAQKAEKELNDWSQQNLKDTHEREQARKDIAQKEFDDNEKKLAQIQAQNDVESQHWIDVKASRKKNRDDEKQLHNMKVSFANDSISQGLALLSMYKDNSKEAFAMTKALSIAQATMNAYNAAVTAISAPPTGFGPTPWGFAAAGVAVAFGLAQVAQIAATPFKAALGADFITNGKRLMLVGDNPGGKERVQVTPMSSPNINGSKNTTTNTTRIIPVVIIRGGNIRNELEKSSHLRELDWERILPKGVLK